MLLSEEEIEAEGWQVVGTYDNPDGSKGHYWGVDPAKAAAYAERRVRERRERRTRWRQREAEEQAYTTWVNSLDTSARK